MATKFYLPSAGNTVNISPAFSAGWEVTSVAQRRGMITHRSGSPRIFIRTGAPTGVDQLICQFISRPLASQTLGGTYRGVALGSTWPTAGGAYLNFALAKCDASGTQVTPIQAVTQITFGATLVPPAFSGAASRSRIFEVNAFDQMIDFTSAPINSEDRLIFEIGVHENNSTGQYNQIVFQDSITEADLTWTQNLVSGNPWVEFSSDIVFFEAPAPLMTRVGAKRIR